MSSPPGEVTLLLHAAKQGAAGAEERLIELVYRELRRLAAIYLRQEKPNHTLQPTALVNEAYLKLTRLEPVDWQSRSQFFGVAAKLMRNILVDHARARAADKRGGNCQIVEFNDAIFSTPERTREILALDDALNRLAKIDPRQSKIVELRFFSGLNEEEIGELLGITSRTVKRDWSHAKAWLYRELHG